VRQLKPEANAVFGGQYRIAGHDVSNRRRRLMIFAAKGEVITANWVEAEQLFGCCASLTVSFRCSRVWYIAPTAAC
jgi:Lon-like ATP-dependent protease